MGKLLTLLTVVCSLGLSGCVYFSDRDFGDCYNTTKWCWTHGYASGPRQLPEGNTLGQCIGSSGYYLLGIGALVTEPVGWVVQTAETLVLAPVYDTLLLPVDLCCTSETEAQEKARKAIEKDNERMAEEWRRREELARRQLELDDLNAQVDKVKPAPEPEETLFGQ